MNKLVFLFISSILFVSVGSAQLVINEIAPSATLLQDAAGKYEDWIEIYNQGSDPVSLEGAFLSDDRSEPTKWQIPAGVEVPANGYLVLFADGDPEEGPRHLDFNLKKSGESVVLSDVNGSEIDAVDFPRVAFRASYARMSDGSFTLSGIPTPGSQNPANFAYQAPPEASVTSGGYSSAISVELSSSIPGARIYYTTDGSVPSTQSALYQSAISLTETTALRVMSTATGYAPSRDEVYTYLINDPLSEGFAALMLTSDPKNFFDDEEGIYVVGTNGVERYCADPGQPANYFQDWEKPANFQMILQDGSLAFDVDGETNINGVCSRRLPQKSLALSLKEKQYGTEDIDYQIFPQRGDNSYERLKIRNGGQDWSRVLMRDMMNQGLLYGKMDIDIQLGRPVIMYLNGDFWGIHNIREKYRPHYFDQNYGVDEDDLMIIKSPGLFYAEIKHGPDSFGVIPSNYNRLYDWVEQADLTDNAQAAEFASKVDINSLLNYWTVMTYMGNRDWPGNNLTVWRDLSDEDSKWRYAVADTDMSTNNILSIYTVTDYNTLAEVTNPTCEEVHCHKVATLFLRKALEREEWRNEFIQRNNTYMAQVYSSERANHFLDSMQMTYQPYVQRHFDKWSPDAWGGWEGNFPVWMEKFREFYEMRPSFYRGFMADHFALDTNLITLTIGDRDTTKGRVVIHSEEQGLPRGYSAQYFKNIPVRLLAVADSGYVFDRWLETGETNPLLMLSSNVDLTRTPIFRPDVISGLNTIPADFTIAPNPVSSILRLSAKHEVGSSADFLVFDALGRIVRQVPSNLNGKTMRLDVTNLPSGTYMVRKADQTTSVRFVKH